MKFIADAMLGRLSKWLRILGFDVLYYPDIEDRRIIKIAREQDRIILTRDTLLAKKRGLEKTIFIKSEEISGQIDQLKDVLDFDQAASSGRCAVCNGVLLPVRQKEVVREYVPEFVYRNFDDFARCDGCGKIYWEGSHYSGIRKKLAYVSCPGSLRCARLKEGRGHVEKSLREEGAM